MAKDFAKNNNKRKKSGASRSKKKSNVSGKLILTAVVLVLGLSALLVYLKWYLPQNSVPKSSVGSQPSAKQTSKKSNKSTTTDQAEKSTNDEIPFYRTHQEIMNKEVEIPIEDLKLPESKYQYQYLMPCGSFRQQHHADELKAKIAFAGFESEVREIDTKTGHWFRVELGPYKSKRKAESIRHRLQDNGMNYCQIYPQRIAKK